MPRLLVTLGVQKVPKMRLLLGVRLLLGYEIFSLAKMGAVTTPERLLSECGTNYSAYGSTFESEVQNSLSMLKPSSTDSLGHQHSEKKLSHKIALHFKVFCESKATLP